MFISFPFISYLVSCLSLVSFFLTWRKHETNYEKKWNGNKIKSKSSLIFHLAIYLYFSGALIYDWLLIVGIFYFTFGFILQLHYISYALIYDWFVDYFYHLSFTLHLSFIILTNHYIYRLLDIYFIIFAYFYIIILWSFHNL